MKSSRVLCLIAVSFVMATERTSGQAGQDPPPGEEQTDRYREAMVPMIGLHGSYDFSGNDWGVGAHVDLPVGPYLRFNPSGDIYMRNGTTWQGNLDASLFLLLLRPGGGLAIVDGARVNSGQAELGYNLFVALQPLGQHRPFGNLLPFAEARWTFVDGRRIFRVAGGLSIALE